MKFMAAEQVENSGLNSTTAIARLITPIDLPGPSALTFDPSFKIIALRPDSNPQNCAWMASQHNDDSRKFFPWYMTINFMKVHILASTDFLCEWYHTEKKGRHFSGYII